MGDYTPIGALEAPRLSHGALRTPHRWHRAEPTGLFRPGRAVVTRVPPHVSVRRCVVLTCGMVLGECDGSPVHGSDHPARVVRTCDEPGPEVTSPSHPRLGKVAPGVPVFPLPILRWACWGRCTRYSTEVRVVLLGGAGGTLRRCSRYPLTARQRRGPLTFWAGSVAESTGRRRGGAGYRP